jgi:hypothetical protein
MKTFQQDFLDKLNEQNTGTGWIWLVHIVADYSLTATTVFRFANHPSTVVFDEKKYYGFPMQIGPLESDSEGAIPTLQLSFSNITREAARYFETATPHTAYLRGSSCRMPH